MGNVTIVRIDPIKSKIRILLDNGNQYWLPAKELNTHSFSEGQLIDPEELKQEVQLIQYPKALDQAVRALARRSCSVREIRRILSRHQYCEDVIELVLYKLEKEKLLNDREFCEQWIQYRFGMKYGKNRIIQELKQKGIADEIIRDAFERIDHSDEKEHAVSLALKLWSRRKKDEDLTKARQKVILSLVRKGYDWETAKEASREAENQLNT